MRCISTLTSNGRVTIPKAIRKAIRDEFELKPHDHIEFIVENGDVKLGKASPSPGDLKGRPPAIGVLMEEWDEIIRDDVTQQYAEISLSDSAAE